jgi:hypothetical protein
MPLMSYHTHNPVVVKPGEPGKTSPPGHGAGEAGRFFPDDHGPGDPVIAGVLARLLEKLVRNGGAINPSLATGFVVPFDPEIFKFTALELMDELGVKMLFHSFASSLYREGDVTRVVLETKTGPLVIEAGTVVDCTGDGDMAVSAGAEYYSGREEDGLVQPMTLMFRLADFHREAFREYIGTHPDQWRGVYGLWDLVRKAAQAGELDLKREDILFFDTLHGKELSINSTRITNVSGTSVWDLSFAEWEGRKQVRQIIAFLKKYVPGFAESYVMQTGVAVGVRETRRIRGRYMLTADDVMRAAKFEDVIARCSYPMDVHNPAGKGTLIKRLPAGESYDIPLRCLIPLNTRNMLVAGRCISGDHEAHSSYRVMPVSMATGHAAGVCAAMASQKGADPADIDPSGVQAELRKQGAIL